MSANVGALNIRAFMFDGDLSADGRESFGQADERGCPGLLEQRDVVVPSGPLLGHHNVGPYEPRSPPDALL
jgi:hypothetical protein